VAPIKHPTAAVVKAWTPWVILTGFVFVWGLPVTKTWLNSLFAPKFADDGLHKLIEKMPPVVPKPTAESAVYVLNLLSATGSGILLSALSAAW
jgi:lactate permease